MVTLSVVSRKFNIPVTTLRKAAEDGRLPADKPGRDWLVNLDLPEVKQFLENYRPKGTKK